MGTLKDLLARTLKPGVVVGGSYCLERRLGQGGFGEVWAALDQRNDSLVALKLMPHQWTRCPEVAASLAQECLVLKTLTHPHIGRVLDLVHDPAYGPLLVTELVPGDDSLTALRAAPLKDIWRLLLQLLAALSYLHGRGVLHLDIKPANVLVTDCGVRVIDFGLATIATPASGRGTLAYMAPERIRGEAIDARADLYATGILLYQWLTGVNPFQAAQPDEVRRRQLELVPPPVSQHRAGLPAWVDALVAMLFAKAPGARYPAAKAVLNELFLFLGETAVRQALGTPHAGAASYGNGTVADQFIGREEILGRLRTEWTGAPRTSPAIHWVQLVGPTGVGKTRLLHELKFVAQLAGGRTVWLDAATDATPVVLQPIAEALARESSGIHPPVVICADDYDQWRHDAEAHRFVGLLEMLKTHPHPPVAIWCLFTQTHSHGPGGSVPSVCYRLAPLTEEELAAYVRAVAPMSPAQLAAFVPSLHKRTGGLPGQVTHLLQELMNRGYLTNFSGARDAQLCAEIVIDLPLSSRDVAGMAGENGILVQDHEECLALCRHDRQTGHAGRALDRLMACLPPRGMIHRAKITEHQLARLSVEAAECALTIGRARVAEDLVTACMPHCPATWGVLSLWHGILQLAEHRHDTADARFAEGHTWALAQGDHVLALKCLNQRARCALLTRHYDQAIAELTRTRAAARTLPKKTRRQVINNELGHALLLAGRATEAIPILTEDMALCASVDAARRRLRCQLWRSECHRTLGRWGEARADCEAVITAAQGLQDLPLLAEAYNGLGILQCQEGANAGGMECYSRALELAYSINSGATVAIVMTNIGLERLRRQDIAMARHALETVVVFLDRQSTAPVIERAAVPARLGLAEIARQQQRYDEATALLTTAETLAMQHCLLPHYQFAIVLTRAELARDQGQGIIARDLGRLAKPLARAPSEISAWQTFVGSLT